MKNHIKKLALMLLLPLSLTACNDSGEFILYETVYTFSPFPSETEPLPEESKESSVITTSESNTEAPASQTTIVAPRPENIDELLKEYEAQGMDISFQPIEETEETIIAKNYVRDMYTTLNSIGYVEWEKNIDIDKYMDDGYLKDYILFEFKIDSKFHKVRYDDYKFDRLEAVDKKQDGETIYIAVRFFLQHFDYRGNDYENEFWTNWVGIRDGKVVYESVMSYGLYRSLGVKVAENKTGKKLPFTLDRNPWDNMEDIKKMYGELQAAGYGIKLKEHDVG